MTGAAGPRAEPLAAVVFDMDGVLIDTEPVWRAVEIAVFGELGLHLSEEDCRSTMGLRIDEVVDRWHHRHPWEGPSPGEVTQRILDAMIASVAAEGKPMDGALEAVAAVRGRGLRCAVASSSPRRLINAVLDRLGLAGTVDAVCSAEGERAGKPAPDVYLTAAATLGVAPGACLAVEDSVNGVLSARAAGMACLVIPDPHSRDDPRLDAATHRMASLRGLDRAWLTDVAAGYFA